MFSLRHIALTAVTGAALSFGMIGCGPEARPDTIPMGAAMQSSGDREVSFTAPREGKGFVYDHNSSRLLWSGDLKRGETVMVDPAKNQVRVNNAIVMEKGLYPGNRNDVYFQPSYTNDRDVAAPQPPAPASNNGLTITPSVTVQPNNGTTTTPPGSVTVQPGLNVTPAPVPPPAPQNPQ